MSAAREPLRRVVVAGDGQVGLIAAIGIRRSLPNCEVVIAGLPSSPDALADRAATALPFTNRLHERLGIAEEVIIRRAGGSHRLVTRLFGWDGQGSQHAVPYGGTDLAVSAFARAWGENSGRGGNALPGSSLADLLAQSGRFAAPPADRATPISQVEYALRWHPAAYRDILTARARQLGVAQVAGAVATLDIAEGSELRAIIMENGQRIEADFYVDCSGTGARLLSGLTGFAVEDWSSNLPPLAVHRAPAGEPMVALEDRISLLEEGWLLEFAGRDGLHLEFAAPLELPLERVRAIMADEIESRVEIRPRCVRRAWIGNVVAIGDAAALLHPLLGLPLDLAHRQVDLLLEMLPGRVIEPAERDEYNRRAALVAKGARDCLGAFYAAPAAGQALGATTPSDRLAQTIDQFHRRGLVPFWEESPLARQELAALLRALGFAGESPPVLQSQDADTIARKLAEQARAAMEFAPPYAQWLSALLRRTSAASRG